MNLRTASLNALIATSYYRALYASGDDCAKCHGEIIDAQTDLRTALGIDPAFDDTAREVDELSLLETIAARLSRSRETALLAGAIIRAIGQHRAGAELHSLVATE